MAAENCTLETDFGPVFTAEQIDTIDADCNEKWGQKRRMTLAVMSRSKAQLVEGFGVDKGPDVLLDLLEDVMDFRNHMKDCLEMADSACARLLMVSEIVIGNE